jgi:hypothetical protein
MNITNVSQAILLDKWIIVFCLVLSGGTTIICLWLLRRRAHTNAARETYRAQDPTPSSRRGARLRQVYFPNDDSGKGGPSPDIDIIAIHGLDTHSSDTW